MLRGHGRSLLAAGLVLAGGLTVSLLFLLADSQLLGLELRTLDLRFRERGPVDVSHSPLVVVEVDNRSYTDLDAIWPFSRAWHARMLQNLLDAGARAVVFDIMFTTSSDSLGDRLLQEALQRAVDEGRTVILSGELAQERLPDGSSYVRLDPPLKRFHDTGTPWGLVDDIIDGDRINRRYHLFQPYRGELLPTIGTKLIMELEGVERLEIPTSDTLHIGRRSVPLVRGLSNIMRTHYRGPTGTYPRYSFSSILDDADFDLPDPDLDSDYMELMKDLEMYSMLFGEEDPHPFRDKIVLVGHSADDLHDNKGIPWQGADGTTMEMPGVETHAHAVQTMLDERYIYELSWPRELLLVLGMSLAGTLIVLTLGPLPAALLTGGLLFGWYWLCLWSFSEHTIWLPMLAPLIGAAAAWVSGVLQQFLRARRERQEVRNIFSRYVSKAVVNEVLKNPDAATLGGEERVITALFSDIASFTTISEGLSPEQLQQLLNEYLSAMTHLVFEHGGILDKYIGDAIVAEFGAPLPMEDHALAAVKTAVRMQEVILELQPGWTAAGFPVIKARIGLNSGPMAVGNFGSDEVQQYTAIGDNMNLAARLEGANKFYGTLVMVSGATWEQVREHFVGRELDCIRVKGKEEGVFVYEVICDRQSPRAADAATLCAEYGEGRRLMAERRFEEAAGHFRGLLAAHADDGPSREMLSRCERWKVDPPAVDWDGVTAFEEK